MGIVGSGWDSIQYRGDAADIRELREKYNVAGFLEARKAQDKVRGNSLRDRLLKDAVLLTETLSPRIYSIVATV